MSRPPASAGARLERRASRAALFVVSAGATLAARPAAAAADPTAPWLGLPSWIWMLANLILFFGLLAYFLVPPITRYLEGRGRQIREELEEARERRREAAELQAGLGDKIARLESQIEEILSRAETEGHKEHDAILAQAEREQERLLSQARSEIDHRVAQARQELRTYTAELATRLAREDLERRLDAGERRRIFERNLGRMRDTGGGAS
ncbi:MAG: F0F1 ATP synthase subunit B [Thermoanaerobaculia bacterium]